MTITNIEVLEKLISTALATYASIGSDSLIDALQNTGHGGGFTDTEAKAFADQYTFIDQQPNTINGFSAAVFLDKKTGRFVLAIRGTEPIAGGFVDLLSADFADIGLTGFANHQAVELYRYWKKLTATAGKKNIYTDSEIENLYKLKNGSSSDGLDTSAHIIAINDFKSQLNNDTGLGKIGANQQVDVTGHSLGGNLAYVFSRMFPQNTAQVVTLNAPGLGGDSFLNSLGFTGVANITSVNMEGDIINGFGGPQHGSVINISQEVGHDSFSGIGSNHSSVNGVDGLNLLKLFATLDSSEANRPAGILNEFMRASSYQTIDTYESMLDGLRKTLLGGGDWFQSTPSATTSDVAKREQYYKNIDELNTSLTNGRLKYLVGNVSLVKAAKNPNQAKTDYGQFLSLYFLTPFALQGDETDLKKLNPDLYTLWLADQALNTQDRNNGKANFSDIWYQDRGGMLAALVSRNTADTFNDTKTNHTTLSLSYDDASTGTKVFSQSPSDFNVNNNFIKFGDPAGGAVSGDTDDDRIYGGKGADTLSGKDGNDYLEGGASDDLLYGGTGADQLYGGAGNDQLVGEEGNDILVGGDGNDKYAFTGKFGRDIIKDSDNTGSIVIDGSTLSQLNQSAIGGIIYYDDVKNPTKKAVVIDEGNTKSLIISTVTKSGSNIVDSGNSVTIKNWTGTGFGITLKDATAPTATNFLTVNGNGGDNAISLDNLRDTDKTFAIAGYALKADGGGGKDLIMGMLSTNDTLLGGDNDDIISGGFNDDFSNAMLPAATTPGIDSIDGGGGNDHIFVSMGGSVAHGGDDNDVLSAGEGFVGYINNLEKIEVIGANTEQIYAHAAATRDQLWGDALAKIKFYVDQTSNVYTYHKEYYKNFTANYAVYTGTVSGINYIGKVDNHAYTASSTSALQLNFPGTFSLEYDYSAKGGLHPIDNLIPPPINLSSASFELKSGHKYAEFANQTGANLFGDKGEDTIFGGMYADYLSGGEGKDIIFGGEGHDTLDGGDQDDLLTGQDGNDLLMGGKGNDTLYGSTGLDTLEAGLGDNDIIYGGEGDDKILGGAGDDYLDGGIGIDSLDGGAGKDYLYGGDDDDGDTLNGGSDTDDDILVLGKNDTAIGGGGHDIFIWDTHQVTTTPTRPIANTVSTNTSANNVGFTLGDTASATSTTSTGNIGIFNSAGDNTLAIAGQNDPTNFSIKAYDTYLNIITSDNQKIIIADAQTSAPMRVVFGNSIEQLAATPVNTTPITDEHFLNGIAPLQQEQLTSADFMLASLQDAVSLTATTTTQYLVGGLSDDTLTANAVGSKLIGGRGDDHLNGDIGNDTYLIRAGDGNDVITDKGGNNTIKFSQDILPTVVDITRNTTNGNLLIRINNSDLIQVAGMFDSNGNIIAQNAIQQIQFFNGDVWDTTRLLQEIKKPRTFSGTDYADNIVGGEGNDTLIGNKGKDILLGGAGDDTYQFKATDGKDIITDAQGNDRIVFDASVSESNITVRKDVSNNLIISIDVNNSITVTNAVNANGTLNTNAIESIVFANGGATWNAQRIQTEIAKTSSLTQQGSSANDNIVGDNAKTIFSGNQGNDTLVGVDQLQNRWLAQAEKVSESKRAA